MPFNEFPSLHIALAAILAEAYGRRAGAIGKWLVYTGFCVIGISTLFVYQHHVIDVIGGAVLAGICLYVVRAERAEGTRNVRVGMFYAGGAAALVGLGMIAGRFGWLAIWPAISLVIVAAGYWGVGAGVYGKRGGCLPVGTWILLWPVLVGQWVSLWWYARRCRAWDRLTDRVWIGRQLREREAREGIAQGATAVVDLCGEFSEARAFVGLGERYLAMPVLDLTAPSQEQLRAAADWIERRAAEGVVYVHCKVGYSRTAAVTGAYLMASGLAGNAEEAMATLRAARPGIVIRPEAEEAIRAFAGRLVQAALRESLAET